MEVFTQFIEKLYDDKYPAIAKNSTTAWGKKYQPAIKVFAKLRGPCTEPLVLAAIRDIKSKSSRKSIASIVRQTVKANDLELSIEKITDAGAGYVAESIEPREIPDDEQIESLVDHEWLQHWHYLYGMCLLFGIRGHEVVGSEMEKRNGGWIPYIPNNTKTGYRECWACPGEKVEIHGWDKPILPAQSKLTVAKIAADYFSHVKIGRPGKASRPARIPFPLYNLRHAYAIRLLSRNVSVMRAAKLMVHTLKVHEQTYHRWITKKHMAEMHMKEVELFD